VGAALSALGAFLFITNIWSTLGPVRRSAPRTHTGPSPKPVRPSVGIAAAGRGNESGNGGRGASDGGS
jgi:hypothetical protein